MAITPLPTPPLRSDDPVTFASRADALLSALPAFVTEVNALGIDTAGASAAAAAASEAAAAASANFVGQWADLTGALNVPATVEHGGVVWLLLADLADVTASEPGVSADWLVVTGVTITQPVSDDSTKLASTAFVHDAIEASIGDDAGIVHLATVVADGAAAIEFTQFSSAYDSYLLVGSCSAAAAAVYMTIKVGGSYLTANYDYVHFYLQTTVAGMVEARDVDQASQRVAGFAAGGVIIMNLMNTLDGQAFRSTWEGVQATVIYRAAAMNDSTGAVQAVKFAPSSGTVSGIFRLYGRTIVND